MDAEQKILMFQLKQQIDALREENRSLKDKLEQVKYISFYSDYGDGTAEDKLISIRDILEEDE